MIDGVLMSVHRYKRNSQFKIYLPVKVLKAIGWAESDRVEWLWSEDLSHMFLSKAKSIYETANSSVITRFRNNSFQTTIPKAIGVAMGFKHKDKAMMVISDDRIIIKRIEQ